MKTILHPLLAIFALALCATGCANRVDPPKSITFVQAMHDVGRGLAEMKAAELETLLASRALSNKYGNTGFVTGLFPSEVEVTFNVAASAADANNLSIDLGATPASMPVGGSVGAASSAMSSATRANQITIKFVSALFAKTSTTTSTNGRRVVVVEGIIEPEKLDAFLKTLDQHKVVKALNPDGKPQ